MIKINLDSCSKGTDGEVLDGFINCRKMVACGVSFDDGDSGALNTELAVCIPGIGMGTRVLLLNGDGSCDFLLLLSNVIGA